MTSKTDKEEKAAEELESPVNPIPDEHHGVGGVYVIDGKGNRKPADKDD